MDKILNIPISLAILVISLLLIPASVVASPFIVVLYFPCMIIYRFFSFLSEGPMFMLGFVGGLLEAFLED